MVSETRKWNILVLLVTLLTCAAPIFVTYDLFKKGTHPEISIEVMQYSLINPLRDLSALGDRIKLDLQIDAKSYDNINIKQFWLKNKGSAPVEAQDFHEPLSISVDKPWEIITIESGPKHCCSFSLEWSKVSKQHFTSKPFLFNPGDKVWQTVYLTNTDPTQGTSINANKKQLDNVELNFNARIVNMSRFLVAESFFDSYEKSIGPIVYLDLPAVLLLLFVASALLYWYVQALIKSGIVVDLQKKKSYLFFVGAAILSYATAEVIIFYIVGGNPIYKGLFDTNLFSWETNWHNWTILLIHISASIFLYRKCKSA